MIQIYDSLRGEKIALTKKPGEKIRMYVCGPTVYDYAHLGHGRSAVAFDVVRRFLEFSGYEVDFCSNFTDIEDKMITRAELEKITVEQLAEKIIPEYKLDYGALSVKPPTFSPRATEFVEQMINIIKKLESKGHTYILDDGIYFDISTFPEYGKLSHQKMEELESNAGARMEERSDKRHFQDFVLWKFKKEGEPFWPSHWGDGRPGWHIECSAMSSELLGETFDIHGGGLDLKFPHHECEIAQSECANEKLFAELWMHNGYITINKEKMSKSLGNFFTLKEIFAKYNPRVVRYFLIGTHYRSPIEYSTEMLEQARNSLKNLDDFYLNHKDAGTNSSATNTNIDETLIKNFNEKMSNDFDVAGGMAAIFEWITAIPSLPGQTFSVEATLNHLNQVLQIFPVDFTLTDEQEKLIAARELARQTKDWPQSDALRTELANHGIEVEDKKEGQFVKPRI